MIIFGIILLAALTISNLLHLPWSVWLIWEQAETGWGSSTGMELAVLYPWLTEVLCAPVLIAAAVYFILCVFRKPHRGIPIANLCLTGLLILQYILTNLFIWF